MSTGVRVAIVGDDLTGVSTAAATTAGALGLEAAASWAGPTLDAVIRSSSGVLGVSTSSRILEPSSARDAVSNTIRTIRANGVPVIVKRFDSWLRGSIGEELVVFREAGKFSTVLVVSAYPALGRTTASGVQLDRGRPVHETAVGGSSESTPSGTSHLPTILESAGAKNVVCIDGEWHGWSQQVRHAHLDRLMESAHFVVFDAATEDDLARVRDEVDRWATAGVACTDTRWRFESQASGPMVGTEQHDTSYREGRVVVAVGSITDTSREQLRYMRTRSYYLEADQARGVKVRSGDPSDEVWVIASPNPSPSATDQPRDWCSEVGAAVAEITARTQVRGFVLVGGETAQAVCDHLGVTAIRSLRLIAPGTCRGVIPVGTKGALTVITRSGAVGDVSDLERLCSLV